MFRKISAKDSIFQDTKERYINLFKNFKTFSALETKIGGKAKNSKSNRAGSYANYLIKMIIFYQEKYPFEYSTFSNYIDYRKLKSVNSGEEFNQYNKMENRFPSAALATFERYINFLQNKINEDIINYNLDQTEDNLNDSPFIIKEDTASYSMKRKKQITYNGLSMYPRNINESILAKKRANWTCEYNKKHYTFYSKSDGNFYVESHHLIPMSYQNLFENTIDFADNIVSLCPNCHRKIHLADNEVKKKMILYFYEKRKELYIDSGITIDTNSLLNMYDI